MRVRDGALTVSVVLLLVSLGFNLNDLQDNSNYFFCEIENTVRECDSVTGNLCIVAGTTEEDLCFANEQSSNWTAISNYLNVRSNLSSIKVNSIQSCTEEVTTEKQYQEVTKRVFIAGNETNGGRGRFVNETTYELVDVNISKAICEPLGFKVEHTNGRNYTIRGSCCGYYENGIYDEFIGQPTISCKKQENNVCNPKIQQTSIDPTEYDELGRIYVITSNGIEPKLVGDYEYVRNYGIPKISEIQVEVKRRE